MTRREFRLFLHPVAQIWATGESHGFERAVSRPGVFWEIAAMHRAARRPSPV
jgi:hypothetical protein